MVRISSMLTPVLLTRSADRSHDSGTWTCWKKLSACERGHKNKHTERKIEEREKTERDGGEQGDREEKEERWDDTGKRDTVTQCIAKKKEEEIEKEGKGEREREGKEVFVAKEESLGWREAKKGVSAILLVLSVSYQKSQKRNGFR